MEDGDKLHVVVFPWLAFGHMLPFLELSKSLARRGHLVSFITTPKNIQRLPKVPPEISHLLRLVPFSLPRVDGMAEGVEATSDLSPADCHFLKKAIDGLEQPFSSFINGAAGASHKKPDWIIQDFVQHWIPEAADEAGVPCVFFGTTPASCLAFLGPPSELGSRRDLDQFTVPPPWVPFPTKVAYRRHEIFKMAADARSQPNHSGVGDGQRIVTSIGRSKAVAVRSCTELEPEWLPLLRRVYDKPVLPVGLLPPLATERDERGGDEAEILGWLDERSARSVVYVALGSEVTVSSELLHELALGLELAGLPFLWALRRPFGGASRDADVLPEGFEERTGGFGKVAMGWVPQVKVLAHASVGGFLTHCGWSSVIEGLQRGHPLVMLPVFGDQGLNARMLGEKGIGVEVERKEEDGSFTRDEVGKAVRLVMVDEEGEAYRKKAREMEVVLADKERQEKYLDDFVHYLLSNRNSPL